MKDKKLRIVKKLPQIYLPENKKEMLLKWYDEDLRFQDDIPKTFERGYLMMDSLNEAENTYKDRQNSLIKCTAKNFNMTYRKVENLFKDFLDATKEIVVYFEFKQTYLYIELYCKKEMYSILKVDLIKTNTAEPNPKVVDKLLSMLNLGEELGNLYAYNAFIYVQCVLWYLATTTKTTKYYREGEKNQFYYEKKEIINPKKNKYITTPIYDMGKIRKVKVEGLIKRRKGWTYSHSFQVHGHYRHYKDGKTIFIEPYIKGKGKEEITQKIIINPKEEK